MTIFNHPIWGYQLTYPDNWVHQTSGEVEAFAASYQALTKEYNGDDAGHLATRCEFNHAGQDIDPLWNVHISKLSVMMGAKNIGAAPFTMGGGKGYEAEIVMPKKQKVRLWTGILSYGLTILHIMVTHPLELRAQFEPIANDIISSLRFISQIPNLPTTENRIPLPPHFDETDPTKIMNTTKPDQEWRAYSGNASVDSLQAFYLRELPKYGWEIIEFTPYPNTLDIQFARVHIQNDIHKISIGLIPMNENQTISSIVIKL